MVIMNLPFVLNVQNVHDLAWPRAHALHEAQVWVYTALQMACVHSEEQPGQPELTPDSFPLCTSHLKRPLLLSYFAITCLSRTACSGIFCYETW